MEHNHRLNEINVKNCTSYYLHAIIKIEDFDFDNGLLDEKSYGNILIYWHLLGLFGKIVGFIRVYNGTRHLVLFVGEKYDFICTRIRYVIEVKCGIMYVTSHKYAKIIIDSNDSLALKKRLVIL